METEFPNTEKPLTPIRTDYVLNSEQEKKLIEHAFSRLEELERELGRDKVLDNWLAPEADSILHQSAGASFLGKRQLYDMVFSNEVEWRKYVLGGIFEQSNFCVPLCRRIARQMAARATNYFFGTDPWCAVYPVGVTDRKLSEDIDRYIRWKFDTNGQKNVLSKAIQRAFVRGEAVVKTTYQRKEDVYTQTLKILVDAPGGQPILDAYGDYITDTELWVDISQQQQAQEQQQVEPQQPVMVLRRDGQTRLPENPVFEIRTVKRAITMFDGAESELVHYKDFLCPLNAASVQTADCIAHIYDMPVNEIREMFNRRGFRLSPPSAEKPDQTESEIADEEDALSTAEAQALFEELEKNTELPKSFKLLENAPDEQQNDVPLIGKNTPVSEVVEFYLRYDANEDGYDESIVLIVDRASRRPIYYNYLALVTPDGERPFDVITPNAVDGRWYGEGVMEMFETYQNIVDLLVNRWNLSQSASGRVDVWSPHNTVEGEIDPNLKMNWGGTYTAKPGKTIKDIIDFVTLPDVKFDRLQTMIEFFLQMAMNESGVANANDARHAGLDTAKLATGIRNIEKSGQEMFSIYISELEGGLTSVVQRALRVTMSALDRREVFTYFEGDEPAFATIDPKDVRDLELNAMLLLTRYRGEQQLQSSAQAAQLVTQYYQLPPEIQDRVSPLYRDMLKALQINFADEIIAPLQPAQPPQTMPRLQKGIEEATRSEPAEPEPNL
jgi:hypothetical protein